MRPDAELPDLELQQQIAKVLGVDEGHRAWPGGEAAGRGGRPAAMILPSAGPRRWLSTLLRRGAR